MILIVDDHSDTCRALGFFIREDGFEVATVTSGMQALRTMGNQIPEAIILDNHMPDISGIEMLKAMRKSEALARVPVIFFSADGTLASKREAYDAGAQDYVVKGSNWDELLIRLRRVVHHSPRKH